MGVIGDCGKVPGQPGRRVLPSGDGYLDADGRSVTANDVNEKRVKVGTEATRDGGGAGIWRGMQVMRTTLLVSNHLQVVEGPSPERAHSPRWTLNHDHTPNFQRGDGPETKYNPLRQEVVDNIDRKRVRNV